MYSEKYFKKHILWIRIKRLFFMLTFSIIGCIIGVISSSYIVDILLFDWNLKPLLIAGFTIIFFFISLLISSNSSRYVQDCEWKIETLRTLNNLSNKLDSLKGLEEHTPEELSNYISEVKKGLVGEDIILENEDKDSSVTNSLNNSETENQNKTIIEDKTITESENIDKTDDNNSLENNLKNNFKVENQLLANNTDITNNIENESNSNIENIDNSETDNNTNTNDSFHSEKTIVKDLTDDVQKEKKSSNNNSNNSKSNLKNNNSNSKKKNKKKNKNKKK